MTLYEIDEAILALVNPETGEIEDMNRLDELQMERSRKLENVALWIKDLESDSSAIQEEEKNLRKRREQADRKAKRLRRWLHEALGGQKFSTPRAAVSYRRSTSLEIDDEESFAQWCQENRPDLLKQPKPEINRPAVREALEKGEELWGAGLKENENLIIR